MRNSFTTELSKVRDIPPIDVVPFLHAISPAFRPVAENGGSTDGWVGIGNTTLSLETGNPLSWAIPRSVTPSLPSSATNSTLGFYNYGKEMFPAEYKYMPLTCGGNFAHRMVSGASGEPRDVHSIILGPFQRHFFEQRRYHCRPVGRLIEHCICDRSYSDIQGHNEMERVYCNTPSKYI